MQRLQTAFLGLFLLALTGCYTSSQHSSQRSSEANSFTVEQAIQSESFLNLFAHADKFGKRRDDGTYVLTEPVEQYLASCCGDKQSALAMLRKNGFSTTNTRRRCEPSPYREGQDQSSKTSLVCHADGRIADDEAYRSQQYDDVVVAERSVHGLLSYSRRVYRVILYIQNENISDVSSIVYSDTL